MAFQAAVCAVQEPRRRHGTGWKPVFHDRLEAYPTTTGNTVNLVLAFAPPTGTNLTVVNDTGVAFIQGAFDNLAQGQVVNLAYNGNHLSVCGELLRRHGKRSGVALGEYAAAGMG